MPIAAVPKYFGTDFSKMPPGHRFNAFFPVWDAQSWMMPKEGAKTTALNSVLSFPDFKKQIEALSVRQNGLATALQEQVLTLPAVSISPFMTGTGMEHPLENGFAFLNPYGLPYLPGSSVKGVLRRTAELLVAGEFNGETHGWNQQVITALFGLEPGKGEDNSARGALIFWDVLIEPKDCKLGIDILTPHFSHYYFDSKTPHESGSPNPVPFLVVPPGAKFVFHVQCIPALIADVALRNNWKTMIKIVLEHAFDWLGFGAKTASGYGQLQADASALQKLEKQAIATAKAAMSPCEQALDKINSVWGTEKESNRKQAGGPLDNVVGEEIKKAVGWIEADRRLLFDLAKQAMKWLGKDNKKIREKLAPLNISEA